MRWTTRLLVCAGQLALLGGCSSDPEDESPSDTNDARCPLVVDDADCDDTQRPIVFVHGNFGFGDNIGNVALLFASNGFCPHRFHAIEYDSTRPPEEQPGLDGRLDAFIDQVLAETGADRVDLMGHSNGTINIRRYLLADMGNGAVIPEHAAKVAHYVHLAGGPLPVPTDPPTLCVASTSDATATGLCPPNAARSVVFEEHAHVAVASSDETFVAIWEFLRGEPPEHTTIQCGPPTITLEGRGQSFADNVVPVGSTLDLYELGSDPRARGAPVFTQTLGADGVIGPITVKRLQAYEFKVVDAEGQIVGRQYVHPARRSDRLIRLLGPSAALPLVTENIVRDDAHSAMVVRSYKGEFRQDLGDSLKVNGQEVLFAEISSNTSATVGLFMFDDNLNGASDGGIIPNYAALPFIRGTDVFMDASTPAFIELDLNGRVMKVPNWPSASEGPMQVVFP
jgi:pimeloyl-ACP methyl ester carboxylesterase